MSSKSFLELYRSHAGYMCDKWEQYLAIYDAEIGQLVARGEPLNFLEIGVQNGGSLEIWAKLLPAGSQIVGIDIDPYCAELTLPANVRILTGDASNADFLRTSLADQGFDVIIDDGSHRSDDIVKSFQALFPRLRPSGKYFIEDLHASYWSEFGGSFRGEDSAVEFLKSLIDALHADHFKEISAVDADELAALNTLNRQIARLCFFDSLAVIEKYPREKSQPFVRTIAGSNVEASTAAWRDYLASWSTPLMLFDDRVRQFLDGDARQEVARLGDEVERYRTQLASTEAVVGALRERLAAAERAMTESDTRHRHFEARLQEQERALKAALGQRETELTAAFGELEARGQRLQRVRLALTGLRQRHKTLRDRHQTLRGRLKAIKASWSWRLSFPIRRLERFLRRAR